MHLPPPHNVGHSPRENKRVYPTVAAVAFSVGQWWRWWWGLPKQSPRVYDQVAAAIPSVGQRWAVRETNTCRYCGLGLGIDCVALKTGSDGKYSSHIPADPASPHACASRIPFGSRNDPASGTVDGKYSSHPPADPAPLNFTSPCLAGSGRVIRAARRSCLEPSHVSPFSSLKLYIETGPWGSCRIHCAAFFKRPEIFSK